MKKIAVIAAMDKEIRLLQGLENASVRVVASGIGKVSAALTTQKLILEDRPDLIINSGVAGGLDSSLEIGQIVVGSDIAYHDVWCGEPNAVGQIQGLPLYYHSDPRAVSRIDSSVRAGLILSGDQFISDKDTLQNLKKKFPKALAVDMESAAVAQTCYLHNMPCFILRLISDTPGVEHHQSQYDAFWQTAADRSFEAVRKIIECVG